MSPPRSIFIFLAATTAIALRPAVAAGQAAPASDSSSGCELILSPAGAWQRPCLAADSLTGSQRQIERWLLASAPGELPDALLASRQSAVRACMAETARADACVALSHLLLANVSSELNRMMPNAAPPEDCARWAREYAARQSLCDSAQRQYVALYRSASAPAASTGAVGAQPGNAAVAPPVVQPSPPPQSTSVGATGSTWPVVDAGRVMVSPPTVQAQRPPQADTGSVVTGGARLDPGVVSAGRRQADVPAVHVDRQQGRERTTLDQPIRLGGRSTDARPPNAGGSGGGGSGGGGRVVPTPNPAVVVPAVPVIPPDSVAMIERTRSAVMERAERPRAAPEFDFRIRSDIDHGGRVPAAAGVSLADSTLASDLDIGSLGRLASPGDGLTRVSGEDRYEQEFNRLRYGRAKYFTPREMQVGVEDTVTLLISKDTARWKVPTPDGTVQTRVVPLKVYSTMTATLDGGGAFKIHRIVPDSGNDVQYVPADTTAEWRWGVTPQSSGNHTLDLRATVVIDGVSRPYEVMHEQIAVRINLLYSAQQVWSSYWAVITSLLAAAGGLSGLNTWNDWTERRKRRAARGAPAPAVTGDGGAVKLILPSSYADRVAEPAPGPRPEGRWRRWFRRR